MGRLKKINNLRRGLMKGLTKNVGRSKSGKPFAPIEKNSIERILISRPNHRLGNLLLITPLLQELERTFPNSKIDIFLKGGLGPIVLREYKNIDRIISLPKKHFHHLPSYIYQWFKLKGKKYDLVINIDKNSSSGRLSTKLARGTHKIFGDIEENALAKNRNYKHLAKYPVLNLRDFLGQAGLKTNHRPIPPLNIKLNTSEIAEAKKILDKLVKNDKKTISIFTYATDNKRYSEAWWNDFYQNLKTAFPSYNIVEVLPKENVSQIGFEAPSYYSKDLREICAFIANTKIFIGADSGMMHLAIASQTPVAGLFCVTDLDKYGPYGRDDLAVNTNTVSISESIGMIEKILKQQK